MPAGAAGGGTAGAAAGLIAGVGWPARGAFAAGWGYRGRSAACIPDAAKAAGGTHWTIPPAEPVTLRNLDSSTCRAASACCCAARAHCACPNCW
ncbi:MAG: hypothetical protein ABSG86_02380 [Thermoguttaceae bacterium]